MEPADLNSPAGDDAHFAALLRNAAPELPDDGFSTRVLAALPPPKPESLPWVQSAFVAGGAVVGCGVALTAGISWPDVQNLVPRLSAATAAAGPVFTSPMLGITVVATVLSLAFAFRRELSEKLTF